MPLKVIRGVFRLFTKFSDFLLLEQKMQDYVAEPNLCASKYESCETAGTLHGNNAYKGGKKR